MDSHSIGSFIGAKRREKNLTQEQLAERLGVSNKTISKWENGRCMPDYSIIEALCKELDITIAELLDGKEKESDSTSPDDAQYQLLLYKVQQLENKVGGNEERHISIGRSTATGITFGSALAMVISYINWHSVGWAILHGILGWVYVIYYLIKY